MSVPAFRHPDAEPGPPAGDAGLLDLAGRLRARGDEATALELEAHASRLAADTEAFRARLRAELTMNHDINNALVGVFGNAQLLSLGPATSLPGVKERLDVIQREANRIKQATLRMTEAKQSLLGPAAPRAEAA